jgi:DNA anti-recombination protein RmuC
MDNINAQEITKLAQNLSLFAKKIGEYRENNFGKISDDENNNLKSIQNSLLEFSDESFTQSAILVSDEVQDSLKNINNVIENINKTYIDLKEIQKAIDLATSIVNVGVSILSKNPESIGKSFADLFNTYKMIKFSTI